MRFAVEISRSNPRFYAMKPYGDGIAGKSIGSCFGDNLTLKNVWIASNQTVPFPSYSFRYFFKCQSGTI
jgi:hypothetical protein|tara:strand:+ start:620 stop:826 length:207 start_codon:yes stop_codon:yes gene_type:complete